MAEMILQEMERRRIYKARYLGDLFVASIGAHILNLANQEAGFLWYGGELPQIRVHILFIAPPGYGKSFILQTLTFGEYSILKNAVRTVYAELFTSAGFVGTYRVVDGETKYIPGLANQASDAIIAVEEFSAIAKAMNATHSQWLDTALLDALDTGYVKKDLAAGSIEYRTFLTLWAGTQPLRVELASGLARRFAFLVWLPRKEERDQLRVMRRRSKGVRPDANTLRRLREQIKILNEKARRLIDVEIGEDFYRLMDEWHVPHYEEMIYERIAMGYEFMRGRVENRVLRVRVDEELEMLLRKSMKWRLEAGMGTHLAQIIVLLRDLGGEASIKQLQREAIVYGIDPRDLSTLLGDLVRMKQVRLREGRVVLREYD